MNRSSNTPNTRRLARAGLAVLLVLALFGCWQVLQLERQKQALQQDLAEISHVRYGLLSVEAWQQRFTQILELKIREAELSPENWQRLRERTEALIIHMLDRAAEIIRENHQQEGVSGWFKQRAFKTLVDLEALKEDAPRLADTLIGFVAQPENRHRMQAFIFERLREYAARTVGKLDYTLYNQILERHQAPSGEALQPRLRARIGALEQTAERYTLLALGAVLAFLILARLLRQFDRWGLSLLAMLSLGVLVVGVASPMIDIEAKIDRLEFELAGEPVSFQNQVLFFQSKSILEVVQVLTERGDPKLTLVAGLILLFSVLFPLGKTLLSVQYLHWSGPRFRANPLVRFFVFKSAKWSMADVMVVAIFMAYLGFAGVMDHQLAQLPQTLDVLTTSHSRLEPGFYFFLGFCLLGLLLGQLMEAWKRSGDHPA